MASKVGFHDPSGHGRGGGHRPVSRADQLSAQQDKRTFPNFFVDSPGDDNTIQGGIGFQVPGFGFGIPGLGSIDIHGPRIGIGGTLKQVGKRSGGYAHGRPGQPGEGEMTFADYLSMAQEMMQESGAGGPDYSAVEEALRRNALESDAKLEAMYRQLHGSIDADAPTIAGAYNQATGDIGRNADQASAGVSAGYQAARDAQTAQLDALGIQDAASVLASQGGNAAADQAHAVGNIEQNRQTGQQQSTLNKASALDYNTNIGNAAILGGTEARGAIQSQLMDALAELAMRKSQTQSESGSSALDLALQLQGQGQQGGLSPEDQQNFAEFMYQQQNDSTERSDRIFQMLFQQYDGDMQKAAQAFAQLQASGLA